MSSQRLVLVKTIAIFLAIVIGIYYALQYMNGVTTKLQYKDIPFISVSFVPNCDLPGNLFRTEYISNIMQSNLTEVTPVFPKTKKDKCMNTIKWKSVANFSKNEENRHNLCVRSNSDPKPIFQTSIQRLDRTINSAFFSFLRKKSDVVVIEIGGFTGQLLKKLIPITGAKYYVVIEPVPSFYNILTSNIKNLRLNSTVKTYNFGLGRNYTKLAVGVKGDATSVLKEKSQKTELIRIVSIVDFFVQLGVGCKTVDLLTINCEGCEFDVLETLLSTTLIEKLEYIQFQPHHAVPNLGNYPCRYCRLRQLLMRTHEIAYEYPHVWEAWKRKEMK